MTDASQNPRTIGRYEVLRLLGAGAMGSVYLAEDPRLKRKVAIKVIRLDAVRGEEDRKEVLARFEREAEISSLLNDPGIVTIYDLGDSDVGPFLAMEYVEGSSLDGLIRAGTAATLTLGSKLALLEALASALDHAHSKGIVHRDVKPANVMVTPELRPKLMDFGIARREDTHLTRTGTFLGTPSYASPEQIKEGTADARSDLFSFGVLAFEFLSGQVPFPGTSINTILFKIVNEPPAEVPPVEGIQEAAWRHVFQRVLAKDPAQRHEHCKAFVADLHRAAAGESLGDVGTLTFKGQATQRSGAPAPKRRGALPWLAATLVLTAGAAAAYTFLMPRGRTLMVRSLPEGAVVRAGGQEWGRTPLTVTFKPGTRVDVQLPGYDVETPVVPPKGDLPILQLKERVTEETLQTEPAGAKVVLDGVPLEGVTPLKVTWRQGRAHALTFTLVGSGGEMTQAMDFRPGEIPGGRVFALKAPAEAAPEATGPASVRFQGGFPVRVRVDGQDRGTVKPGGSLELPAGRHDLELSAPAVFFQRRDRVELKAGQRFNLELPGVVELTVSTFPTDGPVLVDGQSTGVNSDGSSAIRLVKGSHVVTIQGRPGSHPIQLQKDETLKFRY